MSNLTFQNVPSAFLASESEGNNELPKFIHIVDINPKSVQNKPIQNKPVQNKIAPKFNAAESATSSAFIGQFGGDANTATSSAFIGQFGGDANTATSSAFIGQLGGDANTATSSAFISQFGGGDSATSSAFISNFVGGKSKMQNGGNNDVNKLVSMLTSESNLEGISETTTETLEAQLKEILKQNGGSKKHKENKIQKAGSVEAQNIRNFFVNLKSQGVNVNVKLNDKSLSEFFNIEQNTTTDLPAIKGGAAPIVNKVSAPAHVEASKQHELDGGANAGFEAFLNFKKHVATKLKISNGPAAAKIAGSINAEMKKKHSDLAAVEIAKKNTEYFDKNMDKVKSEFKELIEKSTKK